ncbi:chemotaxis protein CheA [Thermomonas haemolytica]|uniref:Chemotaxis protein CheA n=1 Tax=Thermomonas haemolytica TaxID=141949 RepID=A0A4R3N2D6_9GAMM|nr:chemotaxis protein CheA [Thermomonas haemolytica]TCT23250.1 two-component system chemotaxis sensor kinase CheA [Thermomonas haemolytica]TNY29609.1 chemotaxis protein CheA [Thermomonas haemolytica]
MASDGGYDARADFLIEAREILDRLGEQVVALEQDPDDRATLDAVFRGFHTIKGGAGFLDLPPMVALCHAFEDRIDAARSGERALDAAAFDGAQRAVDLLMEMLDALARGEALDEVDPALLEQVRGSQAPSPAAAPAPAFEIPENLDDLDFDALLDSLHGVGGIPGATPAAPAPATPAKPAKPAAPAANAGKPASPAKPAAADKHAAAPAGEAEQTVRVDVRRLDALVNLVGELVLARNRLKTLRPGVRDEALDRAVTALDTVTARLQGAVMSARMQPVSRVFTRFPKLARDVARQLKKQVELVVEGAETELDRNLVEALADPLVHLVRNAIDHGIEMPEARRAAGKPEVGRVRLSAQQEGDHVAIEVSDDGAGIDPENIRRSAVRKGVIDAEAAGRLSPEECLSLLFLPGFSTRTEVSDLSGRGVGMDVVQSKIRELSGQVQIFSEIGEGTRFVIRVPLTLAILPTLLVELDQDVYALPLVRVLEVITHDAAQLLWMDGQKILDLRERPMPVLSLRDWLGLPRGGDDATRGVVLQSGEQRFCLLVDRVLGREEVVIKALPRSLRGLPGYAGASLVGDGRMAMILDVDALLGPAQRGSSGASRGR